MGPGKRNPSAASVSGLKSHIKFKSDAMNQVAAACIHLKPPVFIGDDRLDFLKAQTHPIESGILDKKFISDMAALMVEANPRRPHSMPPGEWGDPHNINNRR